MNFKTGTRTALGALLALAGLAFGADYSSWAKYRTVTVNTSAMTLSGAVANIPVLVRFNATDHADMLNNVSTQILPNGADVRVTLADGTTDVPFEVESASTGASGSMVLWIKAPSVAAGSASAATFRVYWNKTGVTTLSNAKAVFDTANGYLGVWHLNEAISAVGDTIRDATHANNKGVAGTFGSGAALPSDTIGVIGVAKKIGSTSNTVGGFFEILDPDSSLSVNTDVGPYTISAWAMVSTCASNSRSTIISKYNNTNNSANVQFRQFALQTSSSNNLWRLTNNPPSLGAPASGINELGSDVPCTAFQWQYLSGSYYSPTMPTADAAAALNVTMSVNGSTPAGGTVTASQTNTQIGRSAPIFIGKLMDNQRFLRGNVDEIRMSKVVRDSNWIEIEYETQKPTGGTAVAIGATQANGSTGYTNWTGHRDILLNTSGNGANTSSLVLNFPVLIRLDSVNESTILSAAGTNGASIRFSKTDDATALPYEIEQWGPTKAAIWVKVDSLYPNNATQKIRMHYGNGSAASESNGPAVFDTATGFVAAWHLGNAAGTSPRPGSVAGSPAAIVRNGLPPVPGIIGMADTLGVIPGANPAHGGNPAAGRYIDVGRDESFAPNNYAGFTDFTTGFAYSVWVNSATTTAYTRFIVLGSDSNAVNQIGSTSRIMFMGNQNQSATQPNFAIRAEGVSNFNSPANAYSFNAWTNIFVTKAPGTTAYNVYKNGELLASSGTGAAPLSVTRNYAWMGRSGASTDGWFGGKFDNTTISKTARSADWVRLSFQNQKAINALANIGPFEYGATVPGFPTAATAVGASGSATVSWTAPASNGGSAITGYTATSSPGNLTCTTTGVSCVVNGLTNGTAYTFTVVATNAIGNSAPSLASNAVTPSAFAAWTSKRAIVLNTSASGANVAATVTKFPVLVRLGSTESAILSAANGGNSIRFTKADSTTELPYQIESWSSTAAAIWVKVDTVRGNNSTQKIYMYYGNSGATSQSNAGAVFDTAQYVAVWHLTDSSDATVNANHGTASQAAPTALAASLIGGGKTFNGTTNWYQIGTDSRAMNLNTGSGAALTISAWANPASCDARIAAFSKYVNGATPPGRQYSLHTGNTTTNWRFTIGPPTGDNEFFADAEATCVTGTWKQIVGTYSSAGTPTADSAVNVRIYVDGVFMATGSTAGVTGLGDSAFAYIGRIHNDQRYMNGSLDEITVAKVARDSNWIKLAYQNQKAGNQLVDIGSVAAIPGAPATIQAAASSTTTGAVVVSWTAPANDGGAAVTSYTVTGAPAGTCTTASLTCTITGLTVGTVHTFSVRATNAVGQGPASGTATATPVTGILAGGNYLIHTDGFTRAYTFRLPEGAQAATENLKMTITDVYGRTVWSRTVSPKETRSREISWNGKNSKGATVSAGMYIVRIKIDADGVSQEITRKGATLKPGK